MRRLSWLMLLILIPMRCWAVDSACVPGAVSGMTNVTAICNVNFYSSTPSPSGEYWARTIGVIFYPTDKGTSYVGSTVIYGGGIGWTLDNQVPFYRLTNFGNDVILQNLINAGFVVYYPYPTMAAEYKLAAQSNSGTATLSLTDSYGSNAFWPDDPVCMNLAGMETTKPCSYSYPYKIVIDGNTANYEVAQVDSRVGGSTHPFTLNLHANLSITHAANALVDVPVTQWPVQLNDRKALLAWMYDNVGKGTYPGNPKDIRYLVTSSDSQVALMSMFTAQSTCLTSGCGNTWWGVGAGLTPTYGSDSSSTGWKFGPMVGNSVPLDFVWMYANTTDGGNAANAIRAVLGCKPGIDAGCTTWANANSPNTIASKSSSVPLVYFVFGASDTTTPPTLPGMLSAFQTAYDSLGLNYRIFAALGHGCGAACIQSELGFILNSSTQRGSTVAGTRK